jgi:hypothetical protein
MEDKGRFPGRMKFASDGASPKKFWVSGMEKSSISLLRRMPVEGETTLEPNPVFMVVVRAT